MKTAIITDSAANLDQDLIDGMPNLYVIPLQILIDGDNFRDQIDISTEEVFEKLDDHKLSTSLPSNEDLYQALDTIKEKGYDHVLALNLSSGLSGTFNAFRLVFSDYEGLTFTHYDTKTLGGGLGYIVEYAAKLVKEELKMDEIVQKLDKLRYEDSLSIYTIDTLKYLRRGGRIGKVEGTIGHALRVKPVITVNDEGVYVTLSKSIGSLHRALLNMKNLLVEKFNQDPIDLTIQYGEDLEKAQELGEKLKGSLNIKRLRMTKLTPVLGIHTGPKMFAYIAARSNL